MNRYLNDILNQARSLAGVMDYQYGGGFPDLEKAAATLRAARNVIFTGMGSSLFAAIPAVSLLNDGGIPAEAVEASELLYYRPGSIRSGTVVIPISRSGETIEVIKLLPLLTASEAGVIGVTNISASELAHGLSSGILVGCGADQMVAVQSYSGTLFVLLLLAMEALGTRPAAARLQGLIATVQQVLDVHANRHDNWAEFLADTGAIYLLGRGPSMSSVMEGALMFNEAARTPSVAMSAAQFRHGPVEVVDGRFRAFVFASHQPTLELDRALAADLIHLGGKVEVCSAPIDAAPFQPLLEIIPVQFAACRFAESKGIPPGEFRYGSQVTSTESGFPGLGR